MRRLIIATAAVLIAVAITPVIRFPVGGNCPYDSPQINVWDEIKGHPEYLNYAWEFGGLNNACEVQALKARIDQSERDRRVLAAAGPMGTFAWLIARLLDPFVWLAAFVLYGAGVALFGTNAPATHHSRTNT
jgi:hypothetical protein